MSTQTIMTNIMSNYSASDLLTKYEKTKIIGMRLEQIANNAPPMVDVKPGMTVRDIVMQEFAEKKIPLMVERTLPNGKKEYHQL